jgi:hypothetical protein
VVQHVAKISAYDESRKRPAVNFNASRMLDGDVYDLIHDLSTRQLDFIIKLVEHEEHASGYIYISIVA